MLVTLFSSKLEMSCYRSKSSLKWQYDLSH